MEENKLTEHSEELLMFNKFQKTLNNQYVDWNDNKQETIYTIAALIILIKQQQNKENNSDSKSLYVTFISPIINTKIFYTSKLCAESIGDIRNRSKPQKTVFLMIL